MVDTIEGAISLKDIEHAKTALSMSELDRGFWELILAGCKIRDFMLELDCNQVTIYAEGGMAFENVEE